jgi:hypothetical protein
MSDSLDERRRRDAEIRVQIADALGELSPQGKFELCMRLALEAGRELVQDRLASSHGAAISLPPARAELAASATSSTSERDGAPGEEAHAETVSADPDVTD